MEDVIEKFIEKVFSVAAKRASSRVLKGISKKDPELGKSIQKALDASDDMHKRLQKMSPAERDKFRSDVWKRAGIK